MPLLKIENLTQKISHETESLIILEDVSFQIEAGDQVAIVGKSGSGKTTLLSLLAGLERPTSGSIYFNGQDWLSLDEDQRGQIRARQIGFVFQHFHLLPMLTAWENVMLPLEILHQKQAKKQAMDMLERVGLSHRLNHYPHALSGGEQQRVALARAFVIRPVLLLADEPTGSLDTQTGQIIIDLMFDMNQEWGSTLVLVTHDEALAERCDRKIQLQGGRIHSAVASM